MTVLVYTVMASGGRYGRFGKTAALRDAGQYWMGAFLLVNDLLN